MWRCLSPPNAPAYAPRTPARRHPVLIRSFAVGAAQVRSAFVLLLVSVASISCSVDFGGEAAMRGVARRPAWTPRPPTRHRKVLTRALAVLVARVWSAFVAGVGGVARSLRPLRK